MKKIRDYNKLITEIINLNVSLKLEIMGYVTYEKDIYPMITLKHISKTAKKNIVIIAGQHGDEIYMVHILVKWLQQLKLEDYPEFNFYIYPIANPFGYATGSRKNGARQHVNNAINFKKDSDVQELAVLYEHIPANPDLFLDLHGDVDKNFAYAYERKPETMPSIAEKVLLENDNILPYGRVNTIYKEKVKNGVIYKPEHDKSMDDIMGNIGVEYTIALELPGHTEGSTRTKAGISMLNSLLKFYKELK